MAVRYSLENLSYVLLAAGGLAALGGDKLSMSAVRDAGLAVAFLALVIFGLNMIATRRAEIATRYSSDIHPAFHVFRGWAAVAWGVSMALFAVVLVGYAVVDLAGWTSAKAFFRERPGIVIVLAGTIVTAWGFGSAGRATYRLGQTETPSSRWGDRIAGMLAVTFGLCIVGVGLLRTFAPSFATALKASVRDWLIGLIPQ
jgi:hypothetical protein